MHTFVGLKRTWDQKLSSERYCSVSRTLNNTFDAVRAPSCTLRFVKTKQGSLSDFTQNSLWATFRPDLLHLPTTNGEHCTGDVTNMGEATGTFTIDLEWVQAW